jgi:hypothetical protein
MVEDNLNEQWIAFVDRMLKQRKPFIEIVQMMKEAGFTEKQAVELFRSRVSRIRIVAFWILMISAVLFCIGLAVTLITYEAAQKGGGMYFIWYGPMAVGAIGMTVGLFQLGKALLLHR